MGQLANTEIRLSDWNTMTTRIQLPPERLAVIAAREVLKAFKCRAYRCNKFRTLILIATYTPMTALGESTIYYNHTYIFSLNGQAYGVAFDTFAGKEQYIVWSGKAYSFPYLLAPALTAFLAAFSIFIIFLLSRATLPKNANRAGPTNRQN